MGKFSFSMKMLLKSEKCFFTTVHYWLVKLKTDTHTCAYKPLKALYLPYYLNEIIFARLMYKTSNFKHYQFKINWFKNIQLHQDTFNLSFGMTFADAWYSVHV